MSGMETLRAEIARKRKLLEEKNLVGSSKKFFSRAELMQKEEEEYWQKCVCKENKNEFVEEVAEMRPSKNNGGDLDLDMSTEKPVTLSRQEVVRRLRERGEPIRLFAETDFDAFHRLRKIEILAPEVNKGFRNDLKAAMDKLDQQHLQDLGIGQEKGEMEAQNDLRIPEEFSTIEELRETGKTLATGADHCDMDVVHKVLKFLLGIWAKELNSRPEAVKRSVQGKLAAATHTQTEEYLNPLMHKLRKKTLSQDIREYLADIVKFLLEQEYVKANDVYLQMAIGNAPWPIGVTMVGIHARTGREKIFSKHVAHVLNDETQRKYIQGLKRLMTVCQRQFPTDPSKSVEYNAL